MNEKEIFEIQKQEIISNFREHISAYQSSIWIDLDIYIWLNIFKRNILYFFTEPELGKNDILIWKIKSNSSEDEFKEFEYYLKNLKYEFLPIL
jgi:hypothetical protein